MSAAAPTTRLRVGVVTPLRPELCNLLTEKEPRIELLVDQDLLAPMRCPGDHPGDPSFRRSAQQQQRFEEICNSAEAFYGIPDGRPQALARAVRANPALRWVHTMAAGGGGEIKAAALTEEELTRIAWTKSNGPHAQTLGEWAVFGVLAGAKDLVRLQAQKARREWSIRWPMRALFDMTVCVVGLGEIGRACAKKLDALGCTVIGVNRTPRPETFLASVYPVERLGEAVSQAEAVVLALPGTDATHGLVGSEVFAVMRPGTTLVNVGRGTTVDEAVLVEALRGGRCGLAVLDVTYQEPLPDSSPLWDMENVVLSPHTAALHANEDRLVAEMFASNATRLLEGQPLENRVNLAEFY